MSQSRLANVDRIVDLVDGDQRLAKRGEGMAEAARRGYAQGIDCQLVVAGCRRGAADIAEQFRIGARIGNGQSHSLHYLGGKVRFEQSSRKLKLQIAALRGRRDGGTEQRQKLSRRQAGGRLR
jgi:hypothetical protein